MNRRRDLKGRRFGRLVVIEMEGCDKAGNALWLCKCNCGKKVDIRSMSLLSEDTRSCGCLRKERSRYNARIHGEAGKHTTKEYTAWLGMLARCYNPNKNSYKWYGKRGISVCGRWRNSFTNFLADMGRAPSPKLTLDREDNDLGYCKENCRWATREQQNNNRRNNKHA